MRNPFIKLLLLGLGYMFMGNLLSAVMSLSLASFRSETLIMGLSVLFGAAIYLLLVAVPAYQDGLAEHKRKSGSPAPKWRWAAVGVILWAVMLVPSVIFLITRYNEGAYRFINGAVTPLSAFLLTKSRLASFAPYVFMGFYALTVPACHIGYILGLRGDKNNNIMYEK